MSDIVFFVRRVGIFNFWFSHKTGSSCCKSGVRVPHCVVETTSPEFGAIVRNIDARGAVSVSLELAN